MNKEKKTVTIISAPSSFPDFSTFTGSNCTKTHHTSNVRRSNIISDQEKRKNLLSKSDENASRRVDFIFDDAIKEVHELGSAQFKGKQKRSYDEETYRNLTGREKKKKHIPVKIVRGIKRAAYLREKKLQAELKKSGVVTAVNRSDPSFTKGGKKPHNSKNRRESQLFGPSPDVGFMRKGALLVSRRK